MKFYYVLLFVPVFLSPAFGQSDYEQVVSSSGSTLDIGFVTIPTVPNIDGKTTLRIDFINPFTKKIQEHVDYKVEITKDDGKTNVFGPTPLIHTSEGNVKIPVQFQQEGKHEVLITMNGILFQPIPEETVVLSIMVGQEQKIGINTVQDVDESGKMGGGCLIATAIYGSELSPQVQFLREIRDNTLMGTESGTAFMGGFNTLYYSFSPTIADMQRENPLFKETVRAFITPMISTLSIMTLSDESNEIQVLGLGISVIALNLGMYIAAPASLIFVISRHLKSRK